MAKYSWARSAKTMKKKYDQDKFPSQREKKRCIQRTIENFAHTRDFFYSELMPYFSRFRRGEGINNRVCHWRRWQRNKPGAIFDDSGSLRSLPGNLIALYNYAEENWLVRARKRKSLRRLYMCDRRERSGVRAVSTFFDIWPFSCPRFFPREKQSFPLTRVKRVRTKMWGYFVSKENKFNRTKNAGFSRIDKVKYLYFENTNYVLLTFALYNTFW